MKCNKYKFDLIVAVLVLIFLFIGSLFVSYQIGKTQGVKSQQAEILVLRNLNTTHLQKVDSLEIELQKNERLKQYPIEKQKELLGQKWLREELPKIQNDCKEYKKQNPNFNPSAPMTLQQVKNNPCSMVKMLTAEQEYIKKNLKPQKKGF